MRPLPQNSTELYSITGLWVLDTNALLDLYRYHETTRRDFLNLYGSLGENLWIPHQVMIEYLERRVDVIEERSSYPDETIRDLQARIKPYRERIATWANRANLSSQDKSGITAIIDNAVSKIETQIHGYSRDDSLKGAEDTSRDPVLMKLKFILDGKVGLPLPSEELKEARAEAQRRIADKRPPGFMDANKKANPEGDFLIWNEILIEAHARSVNVLLVTGDQKKDWWRFEKGQVKGPLPELVAELETRAGTRLYMLRPPSLAEHAPDKISSQSVQDARRVSSKASIGFRPRPGWGTVRDYIEVKNDHGGVDVACRIVFDDESEPQPIIIKDVTPNPKFGEYARGRYDGNKFDV
jgi:hypothetical protein